MRGSNPEVLMFAHRLGTLLVIPLLASCTGPAVSEAGGPAPAPVFESGQRWVFHVEDGFRVQTRWTETREIVAAKPGAITERVTLEGGGPQMVTRDDQWSAPGQLLSGSVCAAEAQRFVQPLQRLNFPLVPGSTWSQWVGTRDKHDADSGDVNHWVRVEGWAKIATPAGTFDAMRLREVVLLNDEDQTRSRTNCNYTLWYAPAVGAVVREEREANYTDKMVPYALHRTQHGLMELATYTPGAHR
jgi:hypothetical protein